MPTIKDNYLDVELGTASEADVQTSSTDTTAGRLMANGAWGWGGNLSPTLTNSDANDTIVGGAYRVVSSDANIPSVSTGATMLVMIFDQNTITQLILARDASGMWQRGKTGGTWSAWQPVYTGANYQPETSTGIGVVRLMRNDSGGSIAPNATVAGSQLAFFTQDTAGNTLGAGSPGTGTWKNVANITVDTTTARIAAFVRIS